MADKRSVDDLSIEELERVLAIKRREARQDQLRRMRRTGRVIEPEKPVTPPTVDPLQPPAQSVNPNNQQLPSETVNIPASSVEKRKVKPEFEDDIGDVKGYKSKNKTTDGDIGNSAWRKVMDISLVFIEIAAVLGLILIGVEMLNGIGILQQETAAAQRIAEEKLRESIPTLEPTPQLQLTNVVLPSGHTPPNQVGGGQFNFDEIPAQMRALVADQVFLPPDIERPPPTDETPLILRIPKINVDHSIVQGVDWEALKLGIGQVQNGFTPTDRNGNIVLAAHNDIYGELFRYLDQLEPGDQFQIQTQDKLYNYTITGWDIYEPDDVHVMEPRGKAGATLISCYPYQVSTKRIVVFADLDESA
jgi:sortase A